MLRIAFSATKLQFLVTSGKPLKGFPLPPNKVEKMSFLFLNYVSNILLLSAMLCGSISEEPKQNMGWDSEAAILILN